MSKTFSFALIVFCLAVSVWYSPVLFKGYSPDVLSSPILLARNLSQTGVYSIDNELNVVLSSNLIKEKGQPSIASGKLVAVIYAKFFNLTGAFARENLILISISIYALALVVLALVVLYLFNLKVASVFSLIYIFLPFFWKLPYHLGIYDFCLLFFALFFLLFFYGLKQKREYLYLIPAGIFLALASMSKEVIFLFVPFLFVFLWLNKQKKHLVYIFIPLVIVLSIYWLPDMLQGRNAYLSSMPGQTSEKVAAADLNYYGEFFPDPYTYHFNKEAYLKKYRKELNNKEIDFFYRARLAKSSSNTGAEGIGLVDRVRIIISLVPRHLSKFSAIEYTGGPLMLLLIILGAVYLKQKDKYLYRFVLSWIASVIFLLSFVFLMGRSHLVDFGWAIALLASLGLLFLIEILKKHFSLKGKMSVFLSLGLMLLVLYNLILAGHVAWGKVFDRERDYLLLRAYEQKIKGADIADSDVVAVPLGISEIYHLNYSTDKSMVLFQPETIEFLLAKNDLRAAFEKFGVKYVLGYSDDLTGKILKQTPAKNIAANTIEVKQPEVSQTKIWFLNLIK